MDCHPQVGICGCPDSRQTVLGTPQVGAFRRFPSLSRVILRNLWLLFRPPQQWNLRWLTTPVDLWMGKKLPKEEAVEVAWLVGALLLVRKEVLEQVQGFDEQFFLFAEDTDLCRRIRDAGWTVAFTPATSFLHQGGASRVLRSDIPRLRHDSNIRYFRKHHGRVAAVLFRAQHFVLRTCLLSWRLRLEEGMRGLLIRSKAQ